MKSIGIIGGMGATTGVSLCNKILHNTQAKTDHDYIPMVLLSYPHQIADRTEFLQDKIPENPASNIAKLIKKLEILKANVIGMPCNTAHAPRIYNAITQKLEQFEIQAKLINMVEETAIFLNQYYPEIRKIGVLATLGTYQNRIYENALSPFGVEVISPPESAKTAIHQAIYHTGYGIKSGNWSEQDKVHQLLYGVIDGLAENGAQAIILGCSEIPLVLEYYKQIPLFDPTNILARKLIHITHPEKLKPYKKIGNA